MSNILILCLFDKAIIPIASSKTCKSVFDWEPAVCKISIIVVTSLFLYPWYAVDKNSNALIGS